MVSGVTVEGQISRWAQATRVRGRFISQYGSSFQKGRVHLSPPLLIGTTHSTQSVLGSYLWVMIDPLKSDGNRPYALGKGPTLQGGMDE